MNKTFFLNIPLIVLLIFISGCHRNIKGKNKENGSVIVIDLESKAKAAIISLSEIASDIRYVSLETVPASIIDNIKKVILQDNYIFIQDSYKQILCFSLTGQFLYKLNNIGRGPAEYAFLQDFDITSDNKTLMILSQLKVLIYRNTGEGFEFQRSFIIDQSTHPSDLGIVPGTKNILLSTAPITGSEPSLTFLVNEAGDSILFKSNCYKYKLPEKSPIMAMMNETLQYRYNNDLCFKEEFSDTIYYLRGGSEYFQPRTILDTHGKGLSPRLRYDREYSRTNSAGHIRIHRVLEVDRFMIYTYEISPRKLFRMVFDKNTGQKYEFDPKISLIEDIMGGPAFEPAESNNGKLISWIEVMDLKNYINSKEFAPSNSGDRRNREYFKTLTGSLKETDNPILIIVTPKE